MLDIVFQVVGLILIDFLYHIIVGHVKKVIQVIRVGTNSLILLVVIQEVPLVVVVVVGIIVLVLERMYFLVKIVFSLAVLEVLRGNVMVMVI